MVYGQRPIEFPPAVFQDVVWGPVPGSTARTDLTRPYSTYSSTCKDVKLDYPANYPPMSPTTDRACVMTSTPGKIFRGGLDAYTPNQPQNGLIHKLVGSEGLTVSHVESLPSWADVIILASLGIDTLGNNLQASAKVTSLYLPFNSIKDLSTTQFPTQLTTLSVRNNEVSAFNMLSAPSLKYLDLSFNNVSGLKTTVFPAALRQLYLFNNPTLSLQRATFPPILQTLHAHNCNLTSVATATWSPVLDDLILANNQITSLANTSFPPALSSLNLANNRIAELKANFPITLRYLYLGGNPITALYANESQFDLLSQLQNPEKTATSCPTSETYPGDCGIVLSTTATNTTCTGHTSVRLLWNTFPVCMIPNDPRVYRQGEWQDRVKFWNTTLSPDAMPWKGDRGDGGGGYSSFMLVGGVLIGIVAILGAYFLYRKIKKRQDAQWYNEIVTKDKGVLDATEQCEIHNDIRHDPSLGVFRIPATNIERGAVLARGGYGIVYIATLRTVGSPPAQVAMKQMLPEKVQNVDAIEQFMDEIRVSARLYHPKIVSFIGVSWTNLANLSMINEYMTGGDLWSLLEVNRTQRRIEWNVQPAFRVDFDRTWLSTTSASATQPAGRQFAGLDDPNVAFSKFSVLVDVAHALQYLHAPEINIIHRDVKAKNVLLQRTPAAVAKLTDFGTSRETSEDQTMTAEIGTVPWIAPEVLMGVRYTEKADIYSFGVLMSEIDLSMVPYSDLKMVVPTAGVSVAMAKARISMMVVSGELRPSFSKTCPQAVIDIAQRCLAFDPNDRPSAGELVSWLNQFLA